MDGMKREKKGMPSKSKQETGGNNLRKENTRKGTKEKR